MPPSTFQTKTHCARTRLRDLNLKPLASELSLPLRCRPEAIVRLGPGRPLPRLAGRTGGFRVGDPYIRQVGSAPPPSPFPCLFLAERRAGLHFVELMPKPWNSGAVSCTSLQSLDSPSNTWQVVYETREKCDTIIISYQPSLGQCRACATFRIGILLGASS